MIKLKRVFLATVSIVIMAMTTEMTTAEALTEQYRITLKDKTEIVIPVTDKQEPLSDWSYGGRCSKIDIIESEDKAETSTVSKYTTPENELVGYFIEQCKQGDILADHLAYKGEATERTVKANTSKYDDVEMTVSTEGVVFEIMGIYNAESATIKYTDKKTNQSETKEIQAEIKDGKVLLKDNKLIDENIKIEIIINNKGNTSNNKTNLNDTNNFKNNQYTYDFKYIDDAKHFTAFTKNLKWHGHMDGNVGADTIHLEKNTPLRIGLQTALSKYTTELSDFNYFNKTEGDAGQYGGIATNPHNTSGHLSLVYGGDANDIIKTNNWPAYKLKTTTGEVGIFTENQHRFAGVDQKSRIDFDRAFKELREYSKQLSNIKGQELKGTDIDCSKEKVYVFNTTLDQISSKDYNFKGIQDDTRILINVDTTGKTEGKFFNNISFNRQNNDWNKYGSNVMFNFSDFNGTITFGQTRSGNILAPDARVVFREGHCGRIIADTVESYAFNNNGDNPELHDCGSIWSLPEQSKTYIIDVKKDNLPDDPKNNNGSGGSNGSENTDKSNSQDSLDDPDNSNKQNSSDSSNSSNTPESLTDQNNKTDQQTQDHSEDNKKSEKVNNYNNSNNNTNNTKPSTKADSTKNTENEVFTSTTPYGNTSGKGISTGVQSFNYLGTMVFATIILIVISRRKEN